VDKDEIKRRIEQYRAQKKQHERYVDAYSGAVEALKDLLEDEERAEEGIGPKVIDLEDEEEDG